MQVTNRGIEALAGALERLSHLGVSGCPITDGSLRPLGSLGCLESLDLEACEEVTPEGLGLLGAALPGLRSLDLSWCTGMTPAGLARELQRCLGLRRLVLAGAAEAVSDAVLQALLPAAPSLRHLSLWKCREVTDAGAAALGRLSSLRHLDLTACGGITDEGLASISNLTALTHLDFRGCAA